LHAQQQAVDAPTIHRENYQAGHFRDTLFTGPVNFAGIQFTKDVDFQNCVFKSKASFSNCVFTSSVSFKGTAFLDACDFSNAVFLGDLDFSNVQNIATRIDLTVARTDTGNTDRMPRRGITLTGADVSKFKIDYSMFYLKFDMNSSFTTRSDVYQSLLNTFKTAGYTESYEQLDKEYREFIHVHKGSTVTLWLDKYWWQFGYSKHYIFFWASGFVLFFTAINFFFFPFLNREVYPVIVVAEDDGLQNGVQRIPRRLYYALVYATVIFLSFSIKA
jgi:hypothetical protein